MLRTRLAQAAAVASIVASVLMVSVTTASADTTQAAPVVTTQTMGWS
ncbi:hypothetical protein ACWGDE_05715 [Streptomyces sp. NPDC054956]